MLTPEKVAEMLDDLPHETRRLMMDFLIDMIMDTMEGDPDVVGLNIIKKAKAACDSIHEFTNVYVRPFLKSPNRPGLIPKGL